MTALDDTNPTTEALAKLAQVVSDADRHGNVSQVVKIAEVRALLEENERLRRRDAHMHRSFTSGAGVLRMMLQYVEQNRDAAVARAEVAEAKLAALEAQQRPQIRAVIEANIGNASSPHSWRCENPDRFPGYCRCVDEITDEVVAALTEPVPDTRSEDS
jgi:hypothetical protein